MGGVGRCEWGGRVNGIGRSRRMGMGMGGGGGGLHSVRSADVVDLRINVVRSH